MQLLSREVTQHRFAGPLGGLANHNDGLFVVERLLLVSRTTGAMLDEQLQSVRVENLSNNRIIMEGLSGRALRSLEVSRRRQTPPEFEWRLWNYLVLPIADGLQLRPMEELHVVVHADPLTAGDLDRLEVDLDIGMMSGEGPYRTADVTLDEVAYALYLKKMRERPLRIWPLTLQAIAEGRYTSRASVGTPMPGLGDERDDGWG